MSSDRPPSKMFASSDSRQGLTVTQMYNAVIRNYRGWQTRQSLALQVLAV
jgi:hypothetical protein